MKRFYEVVVTYRKWDGDELSTDLHTENVIVKGVQNFPCVVASHRLREHCKDQVWTTLIEVVKTSIAKEWLA